MMHCVATKTMPHCCSARLLPALRLSVGPIRSISDRGISYAANRSRTHANILRTLKIGTGTPISGGFRVHACQPCRTSTLVTVPLCMPPSQARSHGNHHGHGHGPPHFLSSLWNKLLGEVLHTAQEIVLSLSGNNVFQVGMKRGRRKMSTMGRLLRARVRRSMLQC